MWFVPHPFVWGPVFLDSLCFMWVWSAPSLLAQLQRGAWLGVSSQRFVCQSCRRLRRRVGVGSVLLASVTGSWIMCCHQDQSVLSEQYCPFLWHHELHTQCKLKLLLGHLAWPNEGISFWRGWAQCAEKAKLRESPEHTMECLSLAVHEGLTLGLC